MKRENYKRLGDYIRLVDVRNRDLAVTNLLGVSISKTFIPSIANTIGTDMSTYKIVEPYQFAYGPVTSRNGDKITFALYKGEEKCIVSSAYVTFEVIEKEKLDPDYLMMWALRPEFDRYARFMSNGSAREMFSWDDMCEVYLPIPDIDEQRRIVAEYQAVEARIAGNEVLLAKLADTAHIIYRKVFVDDVDIQNLPDGWRVGTLRDIAECFDSKRKPMSGDVRQGMEKKYPYYGAAALMDYVDDYIFDGEYVLMGEDGSVQKEDGTPVLQFVRGKIWVNNHAHVLQGKNGFDNNLLWLKLSSTVITDIVTGGVQAKINQENMFSIPVLIPPVFILEDIKKKINPIFSYRFQLERVNMILDELKDTLLAKLA